MSLRARLSISRQRLEFLYSILIIILVPLALIINTVWITSAIRHDFDMELRHKANLANEIVGSSVAGLLSSKDPKAPANLQQLVQRIQLDSDEISSLTVLVPAGKSFQVLASSDSSRIGKSATTAQISLAWQENTPVAALIEPTSGNGRVWRVLTPVSEAGERLALVSLDVSLVKSDALVDSTLRTSFIILLVTIIIILLLLINHFRFVQYASLFRKLKELDQMKNDFISVATHELKAPMSIIKGYISNVLDGTSGKIDAGAKRDLQVAFDQTDRLAHLVADLLDVSRIEQNRTAYSLQPTKLSDIIQPIVTTYGQKATAKGLDISYAPGKSEPLVTADPDRTAEVFTNLIDNAVKYSLKGSVVITQRVEGSMLRTSVKDTGIGISADERSRLFERFYRVRNKQTENISGTGLGLWIIKQYVEKMHGKIHVESMEGVGSEFIVLLPLAAQPAPTTA